MAQSATRPITDQQRKVLEMNRDHPGATPKDILGMIDDPTIGIDYVQEILHNFELPDDDTTDTSPTMTDTSTHRPLDTLGDKSKAVVAHFRENPDTTVGIAIDAVGCTDTHVKNCLKAYSHLIPEDAAIWETHQRPEEITDPEEISADKQRKIVKEIIANPSADKEEIKDAAGSYSSYINQTMQVYQHLLPDEWCERFPSLSGGETLPRAHGDANEGCQSASDNTDDDIDAEVVEEVMDEELEADIEDDTETDTGLDVLFNENETGSETTEGLGGIFDPDGNLKDPTEEQAQQRLDQIVTLVEDGYLEAEDVIDRLDADMLPADEAGELSEQAFDNGMEAAFDDVVLYLNGEDRDIPDHVEATINEFEIELEADLIDEFGTEDSEDDITEDADFWASEGRLEALEMALESHEGTGSHDRQNFADGIRHALTVLGIR